jgi:flagellar assembly protein FliH
MGRVVKNARVNAQRYQVGVPRIETNGAHQYDDPASMHVAPVVEMPAMLEPESPAPPPVDTEQLSRAAHEIVEKAETQAKTLLADAHQRAGSMISEAAQHADQLIESTKARAHSEGYADGKAAADREMCDMIAAMHNLVDMARTERHKLMEDAEPELVRLAIGIAERVLHQQVALDRGVVVEMAKVAIARLVDRESVTVRVNPADIEHMREHRDAFLATGDIRNFRVVEDQRVDRGGVVVETDGGTIDAKISTQMAEAKRVLHIEDELIVQPADERGGDLRTVRVG